MNNNTIIFPDSFCWLEMVEPATPGAALVAATKHYKKRASTTVDHKTRDVVHPEGATARSVC